MSRPLTGIQVVVPALTASQLCAKLLCKEMQVSCSNSLLHVVGDRLVSVRPDDDMMHLC